MKKLMGLLAMFLFSFVFAIAAAQEGVSNEETSIITYYPAPYGEYCQLLISSDASAPIDPIKYDLNQDGAVDSSDVSTLLSLGSSREQFVPDDLKQADINSDGLVDDKDVELLEWLLRSFVDINGDGVIDGQDIQRIQDICPDDDADTIIDSIDNCPAIPNPDQSDLDTDGLGDACDNCPNDPDSDADDDGICGDVDNCPDENPQGLDADSDGCTDTIEGLYDNLQGTEIQAGVKNSLLEKVSNALSSLTEGKVKAAIKQLNAFIKQVEAQAGKKISQEDAAVLVGFAQNVIQRHADSAAPLIADLSPADGEIRTDRHPIISSTYSDDRSGIDITTVKLTVDGQDVTSFADVTETNITYTPLPDYPLAYGSHQVEVEVTDRAGNRAQASWSFGTTKRSINNPAAWPDWFYAGDEPRLITITAQIYPDKDFAKAELLQLDGNGRTINSLGSLFDDGRNGDAQAGDNYYTIQIAFEDLAPIAIKRGEEEAESIKAEFILEILATYTADDGLTDSIFSEPFSIFEFLLPEVKLPPLEGSLRLMTFNTQLKTTAFETGSDDVENYYGMPNEDRAGLIADQILAMEEKPHIIALQEVFDEDARDELVLKLGSTYPHFVSKVDDNDPLEEDSGLMLFSNLPFAPLTGTSYKATSLTAYTEKSGQPTFWSDVAFIEFDDCHSFPDSMSDKGVGLVRIEIGPNRYVNVAFTHTEASYWDDDDATKMERVQNRRCQLGKIKEIIMWSLNDTSREDELIFVMGDFNINGNPMSMANKWISDKTEWDADISNYGDDWASYWYEWDYHFNRELENSYFSTNFSDSWMYDTVSWIYDTSDSKVDSDPGQTTAGGDQFPDYYDDPAQGERLDYILHINNDVMASAIDISPSSFGIGKYVVQHIRRVWQPPVGKYQVFSDHLPVMADINLCPGLNYYCNPLTAKDVKLNSSTPDASIPGKITYPGSMQWYRVDDLGGSYSIGTSQDVEFEVYEAKDLSRPIKPSGEMTEWGMQYSLPDVPFYIRVFAADANPSWKGNYNINIHLHLCKSKEDACSLDPYSEPGYNNQPNKYKYGYLYTMPTVGGLETVWFKIEPEWGSAGHSPSIKAMVDFDSLQYFPLVYNDIFTVDLTTKNVQVIAESNSVDYPYDGYEYEQWPSKYTWREELERPELPSEEIYYLRVHAKYPDTLGKTFIIHWQTSLTYFFPGKLRNYEQADNDGDDHTVVYTSVDGTNVHTSPAYEFDDGEEGCDENGNTIAGSEYFLPWIQNYTFVDKLSIKLYETDKKRDLGWSTIDALPMDKKSGVGYMEWIYLDTDNSDNCDPHWDYRLGEGKLKHQMKK